MGPELTHAEGFQPTADEEVQAILQLDALVLDTPMDTEDKAGVDLR